MIVSPQRLADHPGIDRIRRIREKERDLGIGNSGLRRDVLVYLAMHDGDPRYPLGCSAEMIAIDLRLRPQTVRLILRHFLGLDAIEASSKHERTRFYRLTASWRARLSDYLALYAGQTPRAARSASGP